MKEYGFVLVLCLSSRCVAAQVGSVSSDSSPSSGSGSQPTSDKKPSRIKAYDYRGWDK